METEDGVWSGPLFRSEFLAIASCRCILWEAWDRRQVEGITPSRRQERIRSNLFHLRWKYP